uniref:Reverse transcriptase domain-containing protein n=1 Tax=Leptobrachium leishanense TaxID=445787 RepID=A0A8C5N182_9ANUR
MIYQNLLQARSSLNKMLNDSIRFQALRTRSFFALNENKPGRLLARILRTRRIASYIPKIRMPTGLLTTDPRDISATFLEYFRSLYNIESTGTWTSSPEQLQTYLTRTITRSLRPTDRETLNAAITPDELLTALKTTKNGKSPGPDGLPIEYYKMCNTELLPALLNLFNAIRDGVPLHPHSLMATISLIPKPEKDHTCCENFRPISLLNNDMKLLARILANRLKRFLPQLVDSDQVGFIPGREARDATTRILNALALSKQSRSPLLLLSADAEKAFDRVRWPFLFQAMQHFGIGEKYLSWVQALYSAPSARVRVNGALTQPFSILNGTRQGCPLSPLLFALSLEPLLSAIRHNPLIKGVRGARLEHKVSAYADDLMFLMPDPIGTLPEVLQELQTFGALTGFKINDAKSELLAVSLPMTWRTRLKEQYPFRWCSSSLTYLGISLTSDYSKLFTLNYMTLLDKFRRDTAQWTSKYLSWSGRIGVLKMNFLPRLLYLFQALPILLPRSYHQLIRSLFSNFIWPRGRPRIKYATLCKPKLKGGLAVPDTFLYYTAAHMNRIVDWMAESPNQKWLDLEEFLAERPPRLLPWLSWIAVKNLTLSASPLGHTLHIWHKYKTKFALTTYPSPLLPIVHNPDLPIAILPSLMERFTDSSDLRAYHLLCDGNFVPLDPPEHPVPTFNVSFNYHQIKSFLKKLPGNASLNRQLTSFESLCQKALPLAHGISTIYCMLQAVGEEPPDFMARWERTLNTPIPDEAWTKTLSLTHHGSPVARLQEASYKLLAFWYRTPALVANFEASHSPNCWRCLTAIGTYIHIWWECPYLEPYWRR